MAEAVQDAIHQADSSVEESGLHAGHGIAPDHPLGLAYLDARQFRGVLEERFCGYAQARRDGPTQILAFLGDDVERYRRAKVHNNAGAAVLLKGGHAISDAVSAHFLRVIVMDRHSGARPWGQEERLQVKVFPGHFLEHRVERRHHAGDHDAIDLVRLDAVQREEVTGQDAVFISSLRLVSLQPPLSAQLLALENSQDRIRVSYVNDE